MTSWTAKWLLSCAIAGAICGNTFHHLPLVGSLLEGNVLLPECLAWCLDYKDPEPTVAQALFGCSSHVVPSRLDAFRAAVHTDLSCVEVSLKSPLSIEVVLDIYFFHWSTQPL